MRFTQLTAVSMLSMFMVMVLGAPISSPAVADASITGTPAIVEKDVDDSTPPVVIPVGYEEARAIVEKDVDDSTPPVVIPVGYEEA